MPSRYREVTISSIVFGVMVGALMNASITYAGLKIGFTIGGSAIAAVLGFGVLRGVMGRFVRGSGSILETNIAQTVASAVNIPNSGVIFTVPVLYLLGYELSPAKPNFWLITLACVAGSVLGAAFIIPLRKQMIDIDRLRFPTGTAVAAILKSPGAGSKKSIVLVVGAVIAAAVFLPAALPTIKYRAPLSELSALVAAEKISPKQAEQTRRIAPWIESGKVPQDVLDKGKRELEQIDSGELKKDEADVVAVAAYTLVSEKRELSQLADRFWAKKPLWGYSDLRWRLRPPAEPPPGDKAAQARYVAEMKRIDRDSSGRADLIMTDDAIDVGRAIGLPDYLLFVFAIAPFSFGAGYITGRPGLLVLAGGVLAYYVLNPAMFLMGLMPATTLAHEVPDVGWGTVNRPLGIGMLLGGALMGVLFALPALVAALKSISAAARAGGGSTELGFNVIGVAGVVCFIGLFLAADYIRGGAALPGQPPQAIGGLLSGLNHHVASLVIAAVGAVWIWFAGIIIAQCTGMTDWSPISGMALITVVLIMAVSGPSDVLGAVLIGAALCVAVTCAADMMQDLKTGHLLGAQPKRQQIVELVSTGIGPLLSMLTILVIVSVNTRQTGVPIGPGTATTAPQAQALKAVVQGVQGGELPYAFYGTGALLGVGLGLGSFPGLGVLVGLSMYLPIQYILTYGLGCLANMAVTRIKGPQWAEEWGIPFCAGLIVGEGVLALAINMCALFL